MTVIKNQQKIIKLLDYYIDLNEKVMYAKYFQKLHKTNVNYSKYYDKNISYKSALVKILFNPPEQIIF